MAVFTFVYHHDGDSWSVKTATFEFELQRHLSKLGLSFGGSDAISSCFSNVTPSCIVCQIIIGVHGAGGAFFGSGEGEEGSPTSSSGAEAPATEEMQEEENKEEEESDDDMG